MPLAEIAGIVAALLLVGGIVYCAEVLLRIANHDEYCDECGTSMLGGPDNVLVKGVEIKAFSVKMFCERCWQKRISQLEN